MRGLVMLKVLCACGIDSLKDVRKFMIHGLLVQRNTPHIVPCLDCT